MRDSVPSGRPATEETRGNGVRPPDRDAPELSHSWCSVENEQVGFGLENGKTVSVCENAGSSELTYSFGVLGQEPELEYRGPLLASIEGIGGIRTLAGLAAVVDGGAGEWSVEVPPGTVADAAGAPDSGGFVHVSTVFASGGRALE